MNWQNQPHGEPKGVYVNGSVHVTDEQSTSRMKDNERQLVTFNKDEEEMQSVSLPLLDGGRRW